MSWRSVNAFSWAGFFLLAGALPLAAQVRPVRVTVSVERGAGCKAEAVDAARRQAVVERSSEATRSLLRENLDGHVDAIVDEDYKVVQFDRQKDRCRLTAEFRVDLGAVGELERSLLEERVPDLPIGVLVRYRVNGEVASEVGLNSRQATLELESALADYGYRMVSLAAAQGDYDRLLKSTETAFVGVEDWQGGRHRADAGAVESSLLADMREYLAEAVELGPMRECGGLVLFGELRVEDGGANPYGEGSVASARLHLQVHRLDNSQPVVLPRNETRQVVGPTPQVARDQARAAVHASVARQVAEEIARRPPARRCSGSERFH